MCIELTLMQNLWTVQSSNPLYNPSIFLDGLVKTKDGDTLYSRTDVKGLMNNKKIIGLTDTGNIAMVGSSSW
jgi:hypothetical protein